MTRTKGKVKATKKTNLTKPYFTGHLGYKWAGPGNSLKHDPPSENDKSGKGRTEYASYLHDNAYNALGSKAYTNYTDADQRWVDSAGNDPVGLAGKAFFTAKKYIAPKVSGRSLLRWYVE